MARERGFNSAAINEERKKLSLKLREEQLGCDHRSNGHGSIESLSDTKKYIRNINFYDVNKTVMCKECEDIFEITTYSETDLKKAFLTIYSAYNQIKLMDKLSDENYNKVVTSLEVLDEIQASLLSYYPKLMKGLTKGGNKGNNNNSKIRPKGHLGVSSDMFSLK